MAGFGWAALATVEWCSCTRFWRYQQGHGKNMGAERVQKASGQPSAPSGSRINIREEP